MPYIGNSQVAGVHQNNFKILDDISSYTETFDGSSSSVVDTTNNTITVPQHRFYHGQRVTYDKGGVGGSGPLTSLFLVGSTYGGSPSSGPVQVSAPLGIQAGDLLIIMSAVPNTSGIDANLPTGFTKIEDSENNLVDHVISYKIAVGNEGGTTYSGQTGGSNEGNMNIFVYRGNTAITSVSVVNTYAWNTSGSGPSSVSVNAGTGDKALSIITTSGRSSNTCTITPTAPASGWTNNNNINGTGQNDVQALSWNYHTRNGNVTANTTYGSTSRATAIACVLTLNGSTGPADIGGLTSSTVYYAVADSHSTIKLATSLANALVNQVINLSSLGSGSSHTLNNSFDGVNKKFKLTHSGGNGVNLTNASHATVAINNVIQKPNLNDSSFTEGFAIEGGKNIVFKTAPTSADTFWGNTIAEAVGTFDSTDHAIDTFTADGTTTNFSLSKNPPSIRDIHITLDGVTQHTSAFSLHGNVLIFSTAPANGTAIQVKHMGFVGASISGVTGFYGRIGNVSLQDSDILRGDGSLISGLNSGTPGVSTTGTSHFNNVSIAGVSTFAGNLTVSNTQPKISLVDTNNNDDFDIMNADGIFQIVDATNSTNRLRIDSNGTVDVPGNLDVGSGIDVTGNANVTGDLDVDGHTNLDNVSVAGVTTMSGNLFINNTSPSISLVDSDNNPDYRIRNQDGTFRITDTTNNAGRLSIASNGNVSVTNDLDVDGHTNLDNVSISGISTFSSQVSIGSSLTLTGSNRLLIGNLAPSNEHISLRYIAGGSGLLDFNSNEETNYVRSMDILGLRSYKNVSTPNAGNGYGLDLDGDIIRPSHDFKPRLGLASHRFGTFFAEQGNFSGISTCGSLNVNNIGNYDGLKIEEGNRNTSTSLNGAFNVYLSSGHVQIFTAATGGNYFPRLFYDGSTTINSLMSDGDVISFTLMVASSSHYLTQFVIEGVTQTVEWVGGSAPSAANGSGYDIYAFTIMSTGGTSFIVIGNQVSAA